MAISSTYTRVTGSVSSHNGHTVAPCYGELLALLVIPGAEARGVDQTTMIIALTIDRFDNDGGDETKLADIVDGKTYRVGELRWGAVVP